MESIIVALITSGMTLIGVVITVASSGRKQRAERQEDLASQQASISAELDKYRAATDTKIDALKEAVEKHNGVIERTYKLEEQNKTLFKNCEVMSEQINEASKKASHAVERADAAHNRIDRAGITSGLS